MRSTLFYLANSLVGAALGVPLLHGGKVAGAIILMRKAVGPFTPRQLALVETFADQAVIAIENVRLFTELGDALQQQTATADVLKVISRSTFDLQTVLDTLVESATRVCEAEKGVIFQRRGELYHMAANHGFSPEYEDYARGSSVHCGYGQQHGAGGAQRQDSPDRRRAGRPGLQGARTSRRIGGYRTSLGVPLLSKGVPVGVFVLTRQEVKPFTTKQIELVETFADQAVIAIENVRLFKEVQARTAELSEALQQQTETATVLKVISRSAFDLQAVLDTLVESATRACEAENGVILRRRGELYHMAASHGFSPEFQDYARAHPLSVNMGSTTGRVALSGKTVHIADVLADPDYDAFGHQEHGDYRTSLGVPLLSKGEPVGVFVLTRPEVKPFTARQIELVETFADQAVIAIENVRLFTELEEALQQQTATADVLKVISRSAFDLQAVLDTLNEFGGPAVRRRQGLPRTPDRRRLPVCRYFRISRRASAPTLTLIQPQFGPRIGGRARGRRAAHRPDQDVLQDREYTHGDVAADGGYADRSRRAADEEGRADRRLRNDPHRSAAVHGKGDRTRQDICRPGRDRHRERTPVRRSAGPHARAGEIA